MKKVNDIIAAIELWVEDLRLRYKFWYYLLIFIVWLCGILAAPFYDKFSSWHKGWIMTTAKVVSITAILTWFVVELMGATKRKMRISFVPWFWTFGFVLFFILFVKYDPGNLKKYTKVPDYIEHCSYWGTNIAAQYDKSAGQRSEEYAALFEHRSQFLRDMIFKGTEAFLCEDYDWSVKFFKQADALDATDNSINQFYPFYAGALVLSGKFTEGTNKMEHFVQKVKTDIDSEKGLMIDKAILDNAVDNLGIVTEAASANPQDEMYFLEKAAAINDLQKRLSKSLHSKR